MGKADQAIVRRAKPLRGPFLERFHQEVPNAEVAPGDDAIFLLETREEIPI